MLIKRIDDVPAVAVEMEGAQNVNVRVLFGPNDEAPTFALRQFELGLGGCTPLHSHPFEHQVVVMQGSLKIVSEQGEIPLTVGDVVMVLPGEKHQFQNASESEVAKMLCIIPVQYQNNR